MENSAVYQPEFNDLELVGEMNLIFSWRNYLAQRQFVTWRPFAHRLQAAYPAFRYFQLPITPSLDQLNRHGIGFNASRPPLFLDQASLRREKHQHLSIWLVTPNKTVIWSETGLWTPFKAESLDNLLAARLQLIDTS